MVTLADWALMGRGNHFCMSGKVYGHPRFPDGKQVTTSTITDYDWDMRWVQTTNTKYALIGPPNQEWVDWCKENGYNYVDRFKEVLN